MQLSNWIGNIYSDVKRGSALKKKRFTSAILLHIRYCKSIGTDTHTHTLVVLPLSGPQSYANILIQSQIFWSSLCIAGVLSRWPVKLTQG